MKPFPNSHEILPLNTLRDLWRWGVTILQRSGVFFGHGYPTPQEEARHLLLFSLSLPRDQDPTLWLDAHILPHEREEFLGLLQRRIEERIPVPYLTHEAWLGPHRFYCDERTLIPRSFIAEALEDALVFLIEDFHTLQRVADVCTGGGSLAILLALHCPEARVDAADISPDALAVARLNCAEYGLSAQIHLFEGDLLEPLEEGIYDLIISNPPYVDQAAMENLPAEYRQEPIAALASGIDGLDHVRRILTTAHRHLSPEGWLVVEVGHQADALEAAFPHLPFIWLDLSAGNRFVFALPYAALGS
ncbi:50S ribosomal protein L3 N(5)-glutamine methyltransferase [Ferrovum myxofaciens]|jgi:ribosomal protein L3 glutamine methyltransferase|uniref:50S ribosomal protein L3 N(5)-glutamine methyltransferase n=2 Tax=root TaxID=1 RepID=A0A8F3DRY1_9PROT|nr:50S ribosomal protein L3 N(5)-glutamine methyltransferase [Ferrovum myxofaciens]MBW8028256.1 50S ribosomal protein L3 N(5)-glutamine methyltransferase [Ferrovum sp.]KXW58594.1 50S ribosomal protein L3 glutamine methyltransferase [Ferrovum myxofaciens]MBU6994643.1 50S ribosomal protein L3 N(5)-glutamine methyltransferase [Ferrovum myxofaciens]NDU90519.1 50S ribosomal protein L3 N(5)-glutamine methyltransferase [Ferrovum sp.]QKE38498.1 MAG: 50S ribosomal protein L3 N(5)-glutamine methyltransf